MASNFMKYGSDIVSEIRDKVSTLLPYLILLSIEQMLYQQSMNLRPFQIRYLNTLAVYRG